MGFLAYVYENKWLWAAAAVALYSVHKARKYYRLRDFGGPFSTGVSEIWHIRALFSWKPHDKYKEACDKYGSIARIGPNDLVTSSPELLFHMNSIRSPYTRADYYYLATRFQAGQNHVFSELDEDKHRRRRQQLAAGYSGKDNTGLEAAIDTHITELVDLIRSKYLSTESGSKPMDFARKIQYLTLDVISHIGFGEPFGDLRTDSDVDTFVESGEIGLIVNAVSIALNLTKFMHNPIVFKLIGPSEKDKVGLGKLVANARSIIQARLKQDTEKRSDMIASFFRHGLTEEDLVSETCLQIIAGSDTAASSLRGIFLYLLTHPRVYNKLRAEIDEAVRTEQAPASGVIPDAQCRQLGYLQAVIKEANRMHPPVTSQLPKRVPDGGDTVMVDGKSVYLPGGTHISCAVVALNRRKDVFGEDADEFRPERWTHEKDEAKLAMMTRTHEIIFGYGKNQCMGKSIAIMEIGKVLFELMRNFDWSLANPTEPWHERNYAGLYAHKDMWVLASDRSE
ncbi:hypothetical protein jhhlp_000511 [Lomentospora prolificans]|uniref:Cytochrome P450 monooxygenase ABA1 n=1 Tax=Lomentospora prolificans TaxID=41688 RepID=A0A2N3NL58_9PEZI|nr:hypothetical protein jhhlp_000511 [Lomentospora prolificans]